MRLRRSATLPSPRLKLLVGRILSYGRMGKAQLALEKESVHLAALIEEAVIALSMIGHERKARISCETTHDVCFSGDRVLLTNMVISLLKNAIRLTYKEAEVLRILYYHRQTAVSHDYLMQQVWGTGSIYTSRILDVYISKLRKYLKQSGAEIITLKGIGYRFITDNA